jgi:hypothetical protein
MARFILQLFLLKVTLVLRLYGLVGLGSFPEFISPVTFGADNTGSGCSRVSYYIVKVRVRSNFSPREIWVKGKRRGNTFFISSDLVTWTKVKLFNPKPDN